MKNPGDYFIEAKYPDTKSSKEREIIIKENLGNEGLTESQKNRSQERLLSLPERLDKLEQRNPKRFEKIVDAFIQEVILDVLDEELLLKLAKALYESEKRIAIERGQKGDIQNLESSDGVLLEKYKAAILEKYQIQKSTLASWFEYIQRNDANYPAWFRYYIVRSLKDTGQFNRDEVKYSTRTETTIAPFPEMNAASISFVKKSLDIQLEVEAMSLPEDVEVRIVHETVLDVVTENRINVLPEERQELARKGALKNARANARRTYLHEQTEVKQKDFLKEVPLNDDRRDELEEELLKRLDTKSFSELYAFAQVETAGNLDRDSLIGEWVMYPKGSDYKLLEKSLRGKGTGWCTAEGSAKEQIEKGDFYVFFTKNKAGVPTEPRVAIRMADDSIAEIRGVDSKQQLEPELADTAKEFYKDLPGSQRYEKRDGDMKQMTALYSKCVTVDKETKEKTYHNTALTREEIIFLYEIDSTIEGFGYGTDPRIEEIKSKRPRQEDLLILLSNCPPEHLATDFLNITESTQVFCEDNGTKITFFDFREAKNKDKLPQLIDLAKKIKETGSPARPDMAFGGIVSSTITPEQVKDRPTLEQSFKDADGSTPAYIWSEWKNAPFTQPESLSFETIVLSYNSDPDTRTSSDKIIKDMNNLGLRPLTLEEMTIAGISYPTFTKTNDRYFVGLTKYALVGASCVPDLYRSGVDRRLNGSGFDVGWDVENRFLCVRK